VKQTATQLLALDRVLARYGSETGEIRKGLQRVVGVRIDMIWGQGSSKPANLDPMRSGAALGAERLADALRGLKPHDELPAGAPGAGAGPHGSDLTSQVACDGWHRGVNSCAVPCGPPVLAHDHIH
jgi:hypothetical protein